MSSSDDEDVQHADMERAFEVLNLPHLLQSGSAEMYTQAVRELGSIFSNAMFWVQASKKLMSSVVACAMRAVDACDFDNQWCLGALNTMMHAASTQKALQKTKKSTLFASFRTAGIMHSRRRKRQAAVVGTITMELPSEVLALVFTYLDPKSLIQCMLVCKEWKDIISIYDDIIWRKHLRITFGDAKAQLVCKDHCAISFSRYASQFPFMLIPYQTKRIGVQGCVRIVNASTWNRLISEDKRNKHGLALKAARYPRVPMFLLPDEVVFWLNRPREQTLMTIAHQWEVLKDRVVHSQGDATSSHHGGRFWQ